MDTFPTSDRELPPLPHEPDPVVRLFLFDEEEPVEMEVTEYGDGYFRCEDAGTILMWPGSGDLGFGALLLGDELPDGTIRYRSMIPDPRLDVVADWIVSPAYIASTTFAALSAHILEAGGNWDFIFSGCFSAYMPRAKGSAPRENTLEKLLDISFEEWTAVRHADEGSPAPIRRPEYANARRQYIRLPTPDTLRKRNDEERRAEFSEGE